jgi:glycosyltransferase involved in cell wall biosynthesis
VVSETFWPPDAEAEEYLRYLSAAKACMFVSESSRRLMKAKTGFRLQNDVVVRNPFNVDYASCARWPQESGEYRMALVGRLDPGAKGQDVLFEVLAMRKWRERALRVNLYGRGRCVETLRRYGQVLELSSVTFCGHQDSIAKIWEENHLLVLPSREEGMPLALVEAMLCGRPALVTNVAGMPELVEDNRTGFIAEAPTVRCLDECMERAWQRRGDWHRLGRQAARTIREIIPPDPVGEFKEYIVRLMSEGNRRG